MVQKAVPYLIFFLSGVSALAFETLWFRQAGLAFGNSVWAGSMVLASFMAGLAMGNWFAGSYGHRTRRPLAAYGWLEMLIGAAGLSLVLVFPYANEWLIPVLRPALDNPVLLNGLRLGIAFVCLLLPTAAMGATLPLMVTGLASPEIRFGQRLGALYATNTLGAMVGALACEFVLIGELGIQGTGFFAASCNVIAGLAALALSRQVSLKVVSDRPEPETSASKLSPRSRKILVAAFLAGGTLLALEVVWFRFMTLFYFGTTRIFATMLAIVLLGIGLGGLLASRWTKSAGASRWLPSIAFVSGTLALGAYVGLTLILLRRPAPFSSPLFMAVPLILPPSLLSGMLFTLMGQALHDEGSSDTRSAGFLTLFNTIGAMCGAWLGGFVLLPFLGLEWSFVVLSGTYLAVGCLCLDPLTKFASSLGRSVCVTGCLLVCVVGLFPHGVAQRLFEKVAARFVSGSDKVVALRETVTGTVMYTETTFLGEPIHHRLVTDSHSMSSTQPRALHYMKQYVYMPIALHPAPRKACLISFGCGVTAKALVDSKDLTQIDIVDISKDILEMNTVINAKPEDQPLRDPRVRAIVEDGRFHLLSTDQRYDLITSEPPPPKGANVVNLYTREYFQLIHDRLAVGGIATYWLPHHSLTQSDSRAIMRAWCDAFQESSLWVGSGDDWMLFGIRDGYQKVSDERFHRQWKDPELAGSLASAGFEVSGLMGADFIGDRELMMDISKYTRPLIDDFPYRLDPNDFDRSVESRYVELLDPVECKKRFLSSEHIRRLWPEQAAKSALGFFDVRPQLHDFFAAESRWMDPQETGRLHSIHELMKRSELQVPVLWYLGSSFRRQRVIDRVRDRMPENSLMMLHLGHREFANRNFSQASQIYAQHRDVTVKDKKPVNQLHLMLLLYSMCRDGKQDAAQQELTTNYNSSRLSTVAQNDLQFLVREFGLTVPTGVAATESDPAHPNDPRSISAK